MCRMGLTIPVRKVEGRPKSTLTFGYLMRSTAVGTINPELLHPPFQVCLESLRLADNKRPIWLSRDLTAVAIRYIVSDPSQAALYIRESPTRFSLYTPFQLRCWTRVYVETLPILIPVSIGCSGSSPQNPSHQQIRHQYLERRLAEIRCPIRSRSGCGTEFIGRLGLASFVGVCCSLWPIVRDWEG